MTDIDGRNAGIGLFTIIALVFWVIGAGVTGSAILGFAMGMVAAVLALGAATVIFKGDGTLIIRGR